MNLLHTSKPFILTKSLGNKTGQKEQSEINECDKYFSNDCRQTEKGRNRESVYLYKCHRNIDNVIKKYQLVQIVGKDFHYRAFVFDVCVLIPLQVQWLPSWWR